MIHRRSSQPEPGKKTPAHTEISPSAGGAEHEGSKAEFIFTVGSYSNPLEKSQKRGRGDQDRGYVNAETGQALIADGMGSTTGGEAAQIVLETVAWRTHRSLLDGLSPAEAKQQIEKSLVLANGELVGATDSREIEPGSGCTLTGVIPFTDDGGRELVAVVNVGDSATFGVENIGGTTEKLTEDETVAMRLHNQGKPIPERVEEGDPQGVITNALGVDGKMLKIHPYTVNILRLDEYRRFVITSDGIENVYTDQLNFPETRQWFAEQVADMSMSPQQLADLLGSKDAEKTDDKLIYVVDVSTAQAEVADGDTLSFGPKQPEPTPLNPTDPDELPDDGDDNFGHPTLGADADYDDMAEVEPDADPAGDAQAQPDDFAVWEHLFPGASSSEDEDLSDPIDPDNPFAHLPPPPDDPYSHLPQPPDFSHLPPPPDEGLVIPGGSGSDDEPETPLSSVSTTGPLPHIPLPRPSAESTEEANLSLLIDDVEYLRGRVAQLHNRKLWGVAGITRRKQMKRLQSQYSEKSRELTNVILMGEFSDPDPSLSTEQLTAEITARKIALLADEARAYAVERNEADINRYGKLVRHAGDIFYGTERKLGRRIGVGVVFAGGALLIGAATGPAALLALPAIRLTKAATAGVTGHDSKKGSLATHKRVINKAVRRLEQNAQPGYAAEDEAGQLINSVRKSDSRRRAVAIGSQALALGAVIQTAPILHDLIGRVRLPHLASHSGGNANGFNNLSAHDIQELKHASPGIKDSTLHAIDKDPEAFNRLVRSSQKIQEQTGLHGNALSERLADTLALSHAKNEFIHDAASRGISAQAAGATFDDRMARLVFSDAVSHIKATTGLTGDALLRRVQDTAALSQIRDQFINQATSPSERLQRAQLFDEQFKQFVQQFQR